MGYQIYSSQCEFFIAADQLSHALDAVLGLGRGPHASMSSIVGSLVSFRLLSIQDKLDWILNCGFDFLLEFDEYGNAVGIEWVGDRAHGSEFKLMSTLAPYVNEGSFIEMFGDDGHRWRWAFDGKHVKEIFPKIIWG